MSDHVIEWLNAYLDGELNGRRLHHVEEHLAHCEACQAELVALQGLSALLQDVPAPEFPSPDLFAAQVNLLLPQNRTASPQAQFFEFGWWMIPVGLLAAWIFFSTAILVSDLVSVADSFGWLDSSASLLVSGASGNAYWTSALGQIGLLEGDSLRWAESTEGYTRNVLPQLFWQVSIALLYLLWIAIGWARRTRHAPQPHGGLLEG